MCASGEWGPAKAIRHFNIHPLTHHQAIFETHHLPLIIKFKCPKLLKFHAKLNSNQYESTAKEQNNTSNILDKYVKYDYDERDLIVSFIIQLPSEGQYGLDIYARDPEYQTEKRTMSHCCKYVLNYSASSINDPMPHHNQNNNNNNNDYLLDRQKSIEQQRMISPRTNSAFHPAERSLSPRKFSLYQKC